MIEFYVDGIEIGDNPIGRGAEMCKKTMFFVIEMKVLKKVIEIHVDGIEICDNPIAG